MTEAKALWQAALEHRFAVVEASAGTGKTYLLEQLALGLIELGFEIDKLLIVTFTEKATEEMRSRLYRRLRDRARQLRCDARDERSKLASQRLRKAVHTFDKAKISTIHAFCQRTLKEHAFEAQRPFAAQTVERRAIFHRAFTETLREALESDDEVRSGLQAWIAQADYDNWNALEELLYKWINVNAALRYASLDSTTAANKTLAVNLGAFLGRIRLRLSEIKSTEGVLDFDDMLCFVAEALSKRPDLVQRLRQRYTVAIVDEFQDTDNVQWSIFQSLFLTSSEHHRLYLVGDPKQAIYGFRGADVFTYYQAKAELLKAGGQFMSLRDNYRSTPPLINALNVVFSQGFFASDQQSFVQVHSARADLVFSDEERKSIHLLQCVGKPKLRADAIRHAVGDWIGEEVHRLVGRATIRSALGERALGYGDIFVLTRTSAEANLIAEHLRQHQIPCRLSNERPLLESEPATELLALLEALAHPQSKGRKKRAFLTHFFPVSINALTEADLDLEHHPFAQQLALWRRLAFKRRYGELYYSLFKQSGLSRRVLWLESSGVELATYQQLIEWFLLRLQKEGGDLQRVLRLLREKVRREHAGFLQQADMTANETDERAVNILTMHKAKGLEADVVFLAGGFTRPKKRSLEPRYCHREGVREAWLGDPEPEIKELIEQEEEDEELRLLYVALTRARCRLYVPYFGSVDAKAKAKPEEQYRQLKGAYARLNARLAHLISQGTSDNRDFLFSYSSIDVREQQLSDAGREQEEAIADEERLRRLRERLAIKPLELSYVAASYIVTSYSQLKSSWVDDANETLEERVLALSAKEEEAGPLSDQRELIRGTTLGIYIHHVLEGMDFEKVCASKSFSEWSTCSEVVSQFENAAVHVGLRNYDFAQSMTWVFAALRTPVVAQSLELRQGLCSVGHKVSEMGFNFKLAPYLASQGEDTMGDTSRGMIRGAIDLVFEHQEKYFVVDWKSDEVQANQNLAQYAGEQYGLQLKIYALALLRMLGIHGEDEYEKRFGGVLYAFLRLMDGKNPKGYTFERPSWSTILEWDRELGLSDKPWGYHLFPHAA